MTSEERREQRYQRRKAARLKKRQETIGKYDDFERVASLNSLYEAAREASKGVDWKASVQRYNSLLLFNISKTRAELHSRLEQYEAVAQNEKTEQLEEATGNMIGRLKAAGIFEEGGIL